MNSFLIIQEAMMPAEIIYIQWLQATYNCVKVLVCSLHVSSSQDVSANFLTNDHEFCCSVKKINSQYAVKFLACALATLLNSY